MSFICLSSFSFYCFIPINDLDLKSQSCSKSSFRECYSCYSAYAFEQKYTWKDTVVTTQRIQETYPITYLFVFKFQAVLSGKSILYSCLNQSDNCFHFPSYFVGMVKANEWVYHFIDEIEINIYIQIGKTGFP